jgi:cell surface protein SprA
LPFNYGIGEEIITPQYDPFNQDIKLKQLLENTANEADRSNINNRAIDYTKRTSINFIGLESSAVQNKNNTFMIQKILLFTIIQSGASRL